jgi:small-conductance mechanosensitive channel
VLTWLAVGFLVRHLSRWFDRFYERVAGQGADRRELHNLDTIASALLVTAGVIITLAILELTPLLMSLLTAAGVTGVIVGFAVRDVAANLISGVFLLIDRPFAVGDFIEASAIKGTVKLISLRVTRIQTEDGLIVTVPNSILASNAVTNHTVNSQCRIELTLALPFTADPDGATRVLLALATAEPRLSPRPAPQVLVGDIRDNAFDLRLICWAPNNAWQQIESDMKRALLAEYQSILQGDSHG